MVTIDIDSNHTAIIYTIAGTKLSYYSGSSITSHSTYIEAIRADGTKDYIHCGNIEYIRILEKEQEEETNPWLQ